MSMTIRRQVPRADKTALTLTTLLLLLAALAFLSSFAAHSGHDGVMPATLASMRPIASMALTVAILSAVALVLRRYLRRELTTSPRRIRRRI
jgi:EamA domain-containing membrane protein RarD